MPRQSCLQRINYYLNVLWRGRYILNFQPYLANHHFAEQTLLGLGNSIKFNKHPSKGCTVYLVRKLQSWENPLASHFVLLFNHHCLSLSCHCLVIQLQWVCVDSEPWFSVEVSLSSSFVFYFICLTLVVFSWVCKFCLTQFVVLVCCVSGC